MNSSLSQGADLEHVDRAIVDLEEGFALLNLFHDIAALGLIDDLVPLRIDGPQAELRCRVVETPHVVQRICVLVLRVGVAAHKTCNYVCRSIADLYIQRDAQNAMQAGALQLPDCSFTDE